MARSSHAFHELVAELRHNFDLWLTMAIEGALAVEVVAFEEEEVVPHRLRGDVVVQEAEEEGGGGENQFLTVLD